MCVWVCVCVCMCVCVLTGLQDEQYDQIMRWFFQASVSDCSILRLCRLLLCTLPCPSCYYNLHYSYHTSSSTHLGVPCLRPSISACHTRSFVHLGVSCLHLSIPTSQPALPLSSCSYRVLFSLPFLLFFLASRKYARVARSYFSVASWRHQASLIIPSPSYPVSLAHTSHKGRSVIP